MTIDLAINTSETPQDTRLVVQVIVCITAMIVALLLGWPLLRAAVRELLKGHLTIESFYIVGIIGAFGASFIAMLTREGAVYFEVASLLLVVYAFGQQIIGKSRQRALRRIDELTLTPRTCEVVATDGSMKTIEVDHVLTGERVRVQPGRVIPIDGVIETGEAFVRESILTGESFAVVRRAGDTVWAGTHALDGALCVRATTNGDNRRVDEIVREVIAARSRPSAIERQADRLIRYFLPTVALISLATFVTWTLSREWSVGLFNAMAVLLIACPCALGLATPLAVWSTLGRLAANGIVSNTGEFVERLGQTDVVVFDKTGTLTANEAVLVDLVVDDECGLSLPQMREVLATVERGNPHPLAMALAKASDRGSSRFELIELKVVPGVGVDAWFAEQGGRTTHQVRIGQPERLISTSDKSIWSTLQSRLRRLPGGTLVCVLLDNRPAAAALLVEKPRPGWAATSEALAQLGVRTVIMTGDSSDRTQAFAGSELLASLDPMAKLAKTEELRSAGARICFVGDGINDAAAMAASHTSIAVAGGAELASEVADATWFGQDLIGLAQAIKLCRETRSIITSNLRLAIGYNVVGITLASTGILHPIAAAVLMTTSSLVVIWRAARLAEGDITLPRTEDMSSIGIANERRLM